MRRRSLTPSHSLKFVQKDKMLLLLPFTTLVWVAGCFDLHGSISPDPQSFLQKYALIKLYESCFGRDITHKMKQDVKAATLKCQQMGQTPNGGGGHSSAEKLQQPVKVNQYLQQYVNEVQDDDYGSRMQQRKQQPLVPAAYAPVLGGQNPLFQPNYYQPQTMLGSFPGLLYQQQQWRGKRQSTENEQLNSLKQDILSKLSNVTCILVEMGILTGEDKKINVQGLKQEFNEMDIDVVMKVDLQRGVDTCAAFSSCLPLEEYTATPLGKEIAPAVMFVNCFKGKKLEACIKKDLRERLMEFSQSNAGGTPEEVEQILARTDSADGVVALPDSVEDMETFVFAMLYEDEPKSLL